MKKKIVIKSFSALSYDVMVQGMETTEAGWPRPAHPRLRLTPVSVEGLNVHPESLAEIQPMAAQPTFDKALSLMRGGGTGNPVFEMAAKPAIHTGFGALCSHHPQRCFLLRSPQSTLRVDPSNSNAL